MKKVIQEEIAKWVCDATGKEIEHCDSPSCNIEFSFGFNSGLDGLAFDLDFSRDVAEDIMNMLCKKYPNVAKIVKARKKYFGVK